jgi:hypothetical protein
LFLFSSPRFFIAFPGGNHNILTARERTIRSFCTSVNDVDCDSISNVSGERFMDDTKKVEIPQAKEWWETPALIDLATEETKGGAAVEDEDVDSFPS